VPSVKSARTANYSHHVSERIPGNGIAYASFRLDYLRKGFGNGSFLRMADSFSDALLWHMERHGTTIAALARASGVSASAIKQVRVRPGSGMSAERATKIAAYYGKTLESFMRCDEDAATRNELRAVIELLSLEESKMVLHQIRGLVAGRASR
jgi:plasmid maintenance system antidote protein VapI